MPPLTLGLHVESFGKNTQASQEFHMEEVHEVVIFREDLPRLVELHRDQHLSAPAHGFKKGVVR